MACVGGNSIASYASTVRRCCLFVPRRNRYKKKWAVNLPSKSPSELALEHFDSFYKPLLGRQWPSVRVSLLSLPKYAAVINNVSEPETSTQHLMELGAIDLIQAAVNNFHKTKKRGVGKHTADTEVLGDTAADNVDHDIGQSNTDRTETSHGEGINSKVENIQSSEATHSVLEESPATKSAEEDSPSSSALSAPLDAMGKRDGQKNVHHMDDMKNLLSPGSVRSSTDLEYFMPTEQVFSEMEEFRLQEYSQGMYQGHAVSASVVPGQLPLLPKALKVMVFPSGVVSDFPRPSADNLRLLNYYLLDAASVLPVLALDVQPEDNVLDLCSAPGGKTLALLQIILSQGGHLDSNDVSQGRMKRLKTMLRSYLTGDLLQEFSTVTEQNGLNFKEPLYNKVLVDVPCNSDRHVLLEEDNNLFKPGRINERLKMTTLQKNLLLAAIKSCKPGGSVVYSTCTLAAVQNDGVVQAALEELWETSDIDIVVEDLSPMKVMFAPFFKFYSGTRLGLLVLPSLINNYGPSYCCKLRRLH